MPYETSLAAALPSYARLDLAFEQQIAVGQLSYQGGIVNTVDARYIDVVVNATAIITTSAVAGNRVALFQALDENGHNIFSVPAPAPQPANTTCFYDWVGGAGNAYSVVASTGRQFQIAGLPLLPGYSAWTYSISTYGPDIADVYVQAIVTVLHIPTGPKLDGAAPLVLTPVLA